MKKNLIILTHGWTGSSVFSSLAGKAGYWLGSETVKKTDYDTFENSDLVSLNRDIFRQVNFQGDHEHEFSYAQVQEIAAAAESLDLTPYAEFVERCNAHRPWVWKDPRLTWTIRVWARVLPLEDTAFLVLTRDDMQAWISSNMRRHIQTLAFTRTYNHGITGANIRFLEENGLPFLSLSFEDLLLNPEQTLQKLNGFLDIGLTLDDLRGVCREPLYRKSRGLKDFILASLIFVKNFGERDYRRKRTAA